eukprot:8693306-Ditylum_brightwellii.AAC.1
MVVDGTATHSDKADSSGVVVEKKDAGMVDVSSSPAKEQTTEVACSVSSSTKMDQMPAHGNAAHDDTDKHGSRTHFEKDVDTMDASLSSSRNSEQCNQEIKTVSVNENHDGDCVASCQRDNKEEKREALIEPRLENDGGKEPSTLCNDDEDGDDDETTYDSANHHTLSQGGGKSFTWSIYSGDTEPMINIAPPLHPSTELAKGQITDDTNDLEANAPEKENE